MIAGPVTAQKAKVVAAPNVPAPKSTNSAGFDVAILKKLAATPDATNPIKVQ